MAVTSSLRLVHVKPQEDLVFPLRLRLLFRVSDNITKKHPCRDVFQSQILSSQPDNSHHAALCQTRQNSIYRKHSFSHREKNKIKSFQTLQKENTTHQRSVWNVPIIHHVRCKKVFPCFSPVMQWIQELFWPNRCWWLMEMWKEIEIRNGFGFLVKQRGLNSLTKKCSCRDPLQNAVGHFRFKAVKVLQVGREVIYSE